MFSVSYMLNYIFRASVQGGEAASFGGALRSFATNSHDHFNVHVESDHNNWCESHIPHSYPP